METLRPDTPEQVLDLIKWANSDGKPLEVRGLGSKAAYGRPIQTAHTLDLSRLSGITLYEPGELVMTVGPATPMADILKELDKNNQELAFEPLDLGVLLGKEGQTFAGSIGGIIAANASGPRRIKAGAARDHFLGFSAVSGRGEVFKSGGRVMKNVTGFDLSKLIAGSFGTLAVMTEVTLKVLPKPEKTATVIIRGLADATAGKAMSDALGSSHEVSAAGHVPAAAAERSAVKSVASGGAVTALRVEGPGPSVEHRSGALKAQFDALGPTEILDAEASRTFWAEVRDGAYFADEREKSDDSQVWRISVKPTDGPALAERLTKALNGEAYFDWGGGLIWLKLPARKTAGADEIRTALSTLGGHATLVKAAGDVRGAVDVFEPQPAPLETLAIRIKTAFDPAGVLNPGRMYTGV